MWGKWRAFFYNDVNGLIEEFCNEGKKHDNCSSYIFETARGVGVPMMRDRPSTRVQIPLPWNTVEDWEYVN